MLGVAVSADGRTAVSGGGQFGGTVRVWDLTGTAEPRVLTDYTGPQGGVAVSADGRTAVSGGGYNHTVWVWDLTGTAEPRVLTGHTGPVRAVAVSADGGPRSAAGRTSTRCGCGT